MPAADSAPPRAAVCPDCGAVLPEGMTTCRALFEAVLVRDYSDLAYARTHRLLVDAYSLQHPAAHLRSGKSFAAHLTGLCAALEYGERPLVMKALKRWLDGPRVVEKPAGLPERRGELTLAYVYHAADADEHGRRVWAWAHCVWAAWAAHHRLAHRWIEEALHTPHRG